MSSPSTSMSSPESVSLKRPDDVATIRFLSSVLSSLNFDQVTLHPPTSISKNSHHDLQFFSHLATMFNTGSYGGLDIAVTGKFDQQGPMVTIVASGSRNSSRSDTKTEPTQPSVLAQGSGSESELGFSILALPISAITVDAIDREIT